MGKKGKEVSKGRKKDKNPCLPGSYVGWFSPKEEEFFISMVVWFLKCDFKKEERTGNNNPIPFHKQNYIDMTFANL